MEVYEKLNIYYQMIVEKNKVMNLTAITDPVGVTLKHFADSLAIASIMDMSQ
ncbi:MAG: class I SAM-dependent methyltransferase, partial [Lachnospiraceae bacterium]|nr:class I SAM-dependent methyltransferase [Lachnospiraceae bacterium]